MPKAPLKKKPKWTNILLKTVAVFWLIGAMVWSIKNQFVPEFSMVFDWIQLEPDQIFSIFSYFDSLCFLSLALLILYVGFLKLGNPANLMSLQKKGKIYPGILLVIIFSAVASILLLSTALPFLISKNVSLISIRSFIPNRIFLMQVLQLALCLGLYFFMMTVRKPWNYIFSLPFFLFFVPLLDRFPLLWFAALAIWLPGRLWSFFRPLLALMSFALVIGGFLHGNGLYNFSQVPYPVHAEVQSLNGCGAYDVVRHPTKNELYLKCEFGLSRFVYKDNQWAMEANAKGPVLWDEASFDFNTNRAFVPECMTEGQVPRLLVYNLPDLTLDKVIPLNIAFPTLAESVLTVCDSNLQTLFLVDRRGLASTLRMDDFSTIQSRFISSNCAFSDGVMRVRLDEKRHELVVLFFQRLASFRLEDLSLIQSIDLPDTTAGMVLDQVGNQIFITYPKIGQIRVYNRDSFKEVSSFDAPLLARPLALDEQKRWLFIGAMTGVVEIVHADTLDPIRRLRLSPWLRRMEVLPQLGQLAVTFHGEHSTVVWDYQKQLTHFDPMAWLLKGFEFLLRSHFRQNLETTTNDPPCTEIELFKKEKDSRNLSIILIEPEEQSREMARGILQWDGYKVYAYKSFEQAEIAIQENSFSPNIVVFNNDVESGDREKQRKEWINRHLPSAFIMTLCKDITKQTDRCDFRIPLNLMEMMKTLEQRYTATSGNKSQKSFPDQE